MFHSMKRWISGIMAAFLIVSLAGCSAKPVQKDKEEKSLFAYESREIQVKELSTREDNGVTIKEITLDAYDKKLNTMKMVGAYMVIPQGKGPFPAVLYFHWLGKPNGNKKEFLKEAVALGQKGVASMLIDGYFPWMELPNGTEIDKARIINQVIEVRRCLDYLTEQPYVDAKRIAFVGHDYGAMYGAILAGVDTRIGSYNLVAGMGDFQYWFVTYWVKNATSAYLTSLSEVDPLQFIGKAAPSKLFFQFAESDDYIPKKTAETFYSAASEPKEVKYYKGGHTMASDEAKADRNQWLLDCLGVDK